MGLSAAEVPSAIYSSIRSKTVWPSMFAGRSAVVGPSVAVGPSKTIRMIITGWTSGSKAQLSGGLAYIIVADIDAVV